MFRTSLLTALLLSSTAMAETPSDAGAARQQIREAFSRVQAAVAKARDERHPVKLTCAANAEEHIASLIESNSDAAQLAANEEAAMNQCLSIVARQETSLSCGWSATEIDEPLFRDPPEVSFNRPVR